MGVADGMVQIAAYRCVSSRKCKNVKSGKSCAHPLLVCKVYSLTCKCVNQLGVTLLYMGKLPIGKVTVRITIFSSAPGTPGPDNRAT